jgi:nitroimidazol reductase NimA-like FMN-containing flavoprotein (pyridoxamine 5'-phosphate oxidase superfamily)
VPVPQDTRDLPPALALRLLSRAGFGRIVYTRRALPIIRPVNHLVDGETIVIYSNRGTAASIADRQVVSYEADTIDEHTHRGWCVIATGTAELVTDPEEIDRYRGLLRTWLPGPREHLVRIHPDIITGVEFIDPPGGRR